MDKKDFQGHDFVDREEFLGEVIDKLLEHPELIRALLDAYFDKVGLEDCWTLFFTTVCTF